MGDQVRQDYLCLIELGIPDLLFHQLECKWQRKVNTQCSAPVQHRRVQVGTPGCNVAQEFPGARVLRLALHHSLYCFLGAGVHPANQQAKREVQADCGPLRLGSYRLFKVRQTLFDTPELGKRQPQ